RATSRQFFQDPPKLSSHRDRDAFDYPQQVNGKTSRTHAMVDPNQFIEDLSDSEEWEEVVQLVNRPPALKRPAGMEIERPVKRGLLGTAPPVSPTPPKNGPHPTSAKHFPPGFIPPPAMPAKLSAAKPPGFIPPPAMLAKPSATALRPSMEQVSSKSFFRMEYPSVRPKIYFSNQQSYREEEEEAQQSNGSTEPAQARIAPAAPTSGYSYNWRHEVPADPMAKHGGVESRFGGYFE
ncbi:hypothetical protein COOONC_10796, partial [Cooperia oncophora]